jgi:hypothetical protein
VGLDVLLDDMTAEWRKPCVRRPFGFARSDVIVLDGGSQWKWLSARDARVYLRRHIARGGDDASPGFD